ncbi:MAG: pectate lyase [candidate division KSB1 bacterium]|nr:pectate lyase [candidate division KSB1 bacterium]
MRNVAFWGWVGFLAFHCSSVQGGDLPAFPGAEGFGARTPGGRGGKVLLVTNLNDSGPGSLRHACSERGPRIIVFRVAGIIDLDSAIVIREPFVTIAGQSAPGDGICLRGAGLVIDTHDVVVRYLRSRPGDIRGEVGDAISVIGGSYNVIIDHCSASWGTDETLSVNGLLRDVTVQWCLIAEGLHYSVHYKGPHGMGTLARATGGVTFHHNLWAHNDSRNPRLGDAYGRPPYPVFDVRNNVIYDFGSICTGLVGGVLKANYVANYIRPGPCTRARPHVISLNEDARAEFYLSGNFVEGCEKCSADPNELFAWDPQHKGSVRLLTSPLSVPEVSTFSAQEAFRKVLEEAGATRPVRDAVDERIVREVMERSGCLIDSQWEVGGWPVYRSARPPRDSDRDGMPDDWERAHRLDPHEPADAAADRDGDGYTNIEEYLNSLAP